MTYPTPTYDSITVNNANPAIVYQSSATGSVPVDYSRKFTDTPEDFGAIGDGSTDDTVALQKWLNAIPSGGTAQLKPGKVYGFTNLTLPSPAPYAGVGSDASRSYGLVIDGNNSVLKKIAAGSDATYGIASTYYLTNSQSTSSSIFLKNLNIDFNGLATTAGLITQHWNSRFEHLNVFNAVGHGMMQTAVAKGGAIITGHQNNNNWFGCDFYSNGGYGLYVNGSGNNNTDGILDSVRGFDNAKANVYINVCSGWDFTNVHCWNYVTTQTDVAVTRFEGTSAAKWRGCEFDLDSNNPATPAVAVTNGSGSSMAGTFDACYFYSPAYLFNLNATRIGYSFTACEFNSNSYVYQNGSNIEVISTGTTYQSIYPFQSSVNNGTNTAVSAYDYWTYQGVQLNGQHLLNKGTTAPYIGGYAYQPVKSHAYSSVASGATYALVYSDALWQIFSTALTANITIQLPKKALIADGQKPFVFQRLVTATGGFSIVIQDQDTLATVAVLDTPGSMQTILNDGSKWIVSGVQESYGVVTPQQFGAKGDGVTDDSVVTNAALAWLAANGGGTLHVPAAHYIMINPLVGGSNTTIKADPGAVFDFSKRSTYLNTDDAGGLIYFRGTLGTGVTLTAAATLGATSITASSVTGVVEGSIIEISQQVSNTGNFSEPSVSVFSGQLNRVTSVSGSTINLDTTIFETLPLVNNPQYRLITAPINNVTVDGLTIIGKGRAQTQDSDIGIRIYSGVNVAVRNCTLIGVDQRGIEFVGCLGAICEDNTITTDPNTAGASSSYANYALAYTSSQNVVFRRNTIANYRHGCVASNISAANINKYFGISRFVDVSENYVTNTWHAGIATHNDAEHVTAHDNRIENCAFGFNLRDRNMKATNNRITNCGTALYLSGAPQSQVYSNNYIMDCANVLQVSSLNSASFVPQDIRVVANDINQTNTALATYGMAFAMGVSGTPAKNIVVKGNTFSNVVGQGGNDSMIRFNGYISGEIVENVIHNCSNIIGIRLDTGPVACEVRRNRVTNITGSAFSFANTSTDTFATDNFIHGYTTGYSGITNATNRNNDDGGSTFI